MDTEQVNRFVITLLPGEEAIAIAVTRDGSVITAKSGDGQRQIVFPAPVRPQELGKMDAMYADASLERATQVEAELTSAREQIATLNRRVLDLEARVGRLQGERRIIRALVKALWGIVKHDA